jgi:phage terminase Nu1 subunit (DNA packaging protein)
MKDKVKQLTRLEVLRVLGISRASLERLVAGGRLRASGKGAGGAHLYGEADVLALAARLRAEREESIRARGGTDELKGRKLAAEARLKELELGREEGALVDVADVEARWLQIAHSVREAMLAIPGVAVQSGVIPRSAERRLEQLIRDALTSLGPKAGA